MVRAPRPWLARTLHPLDCLGWTYFQRALLSFYFPVFGKAVAWAQEPANCIYDAVVVRAEIDDKLVQVAFVIIMNQVLKFLLPIFAEKGQRDIAAGAVVAQLFFVFRDDGVRLACRCGLVSFWC